MIQRAASLAEIAERSESLEDFGRILRDWLHELRRLSSRPQAIAAVSRKPRALWNRFSGGAVADAWLAAYAEYLTVKIGAVPPNWVWESTRIAPEPWFAEASANPELRIAALRQTPLPFKRRNLYTRSVELALGLRVGRPVKTAEEKRHANAERQQRFRERRKAEFIALRSRMGNAGK